MSNGGPVFDSGAAPDWDRATVARHECGADGRYDKTAVHNLQAQERNPLSQILKRQLAWIYACAGRYDEAIAQLEESQAHMGDSPDWLRAAFGQEFIGKSMYPEAIGALESAVMASDSNPAFVALLATGYARAGRMGDARRLVVWLEQRPPGVRS